MDIKPEILSFEHHAVFPQKERKERHQRKNSKTLQKQTQKASKIN
jgi:hypothetical protein